MSSICASAKALDFKAYKRFYLLMSFRLSVLNIVRLSAIISCISGFTLTANASSEEVSLGSTSLCGDAYLLAMAPDRISELSWQSRSPLSRAGESHRKLPQLWDDPEVLINANADIILFGSGEGHISAKLEAETIKLTWGEGFTTLQTNANAINKALNIDSDITDDWTRRIKTLTERAARRKTPPKILYLSRSGGSAGTGTLVDAAIIAAGGVNIVKASGWFTPDPEQIIAYDSDLIITSYFKNGYESVQSTAMRNQVVQRFIAKHPSVEIDGKLWPCAGPGLIEAAEQIAEAIDKLP